MTNLTAARHEEIRGGMTAYAPSRDDGTDPAPTAAELEIEAEVRAAARALRCGWEPARGAVAAWVGWRPRVSV